MRTKRSCCSGLLLMAVSGVLVGSGVVLGSGVVFADNDSVVDDVNIVVPTACTLAGTLNTAHNATINPGAYQADIGTTTLKALCNDSAGFAIYATGYTGNTVGETNSNKLVGQNTNELIPTGIGTSGDSQWAMKLTTDSGATYPITIGSAPNTSGGADASFSSYHVVPNEYTKVAYRTEGTDVGNNATGSILTTTYAVNIASTQSADTYSGKVIYTLVHPNYVDEESLRDAVTVVYDGNGLTFPGGGNTNTVKYADVCQPGGYGYVGSNYQEVMTSNITTGGTQNGAYTDSENILQTITLPNVDKVKVVVDYGMTANTIGVAIAEGTWDGDWNNMPDNFYNIFDGENNISGTKSFIFDSDSVTVYSESWATPESGYDKGIYVRLYPVYNTEQPNTTIEELPSRGCSIQSIAGNYGETGAGKRGWYIEIEYEEGYTDYIDFESEEEVINYIDNQYESLSGSTITVYAYPYAIVYNGNNATAGTMDGFITKFRHIGDEVDLLAYNYYKTGYGFAGWSANSSATVNSSDVIYGPNEGIDSSDLNYNNANQEATLYAVWVPTAGTMQNWNGCGSMNIGNVTALTDSRDNNVYTVGKLADGNCWMMENFRLNAENSANSSLANGFGEGFVGLANSENSNFLNSTSSNSIYDVSMITGDIPGYRIPRYNNNNTNIGGVNEDGVSLIANPYTDNFSDVDYIHDQNSQWYGYGNYYNWPAAIADTSEMGGHYGSDVTVSTSICPKGWRVPIGGGSLDNGAFHYLGRQLNATSSGLESSKIWRSYPNNYVYSGEYSSSSMYSRGHSGTYWTSTTHHGDNSRTSYYFYIARYSLTPGNGSNYFSIERFHGYSVRCVLDAT